MINIKCHDLRHQLVAYQNKLEKEEIEDICSLISNYDANLHTGCSALDIVINEKMHVCMKEGIKLTCLVNGEKLNVLPAHEIYSLMGNAIENAIEAVKNLPQDKRIISITDHSKNKILSIRVENYCDGQLTFQD